MKSRLVGALLAAPLLSAAVAVAAVAHTSGGTALARAVLLRRSDLGHGWSVDTPAPGQVPILTCPRFSPGINGAVETGAAASPTFDAGTSGPFVSQTAYAYATSAQEAIVWRAVVRPPLLGCVAESLLSGSGQGVHFAVTSMRGLRLPKLSTPADGYGVSGTATSSGVSIDVYLDVLVLARGQTITAISLSSFQRPVTLRNALRLARIVAGRMSAH